MAVTKKTESKNRWQENRETEILVYCWWECKMMLNFIPHITEKRVGYKISANL